MKRISLVVALLFALVSSAQELNVGSVNIRWNTKVDYKTNNGWNERKGHLCDLLNFEAFDLFGAQEATKVQIDDMLAAMPDYNYIGVARDDGATKGEYSPVFYRKDKFKLLDSGTFWLSETPNQVSKGWDGRCRRVCTWGYFKPIGGGKSFYFLCTHLDHRGKVAQKEGAKLIINFIKEHCKGKKVVLVGDFNVAQNSEAYKTFAESGVLEDTYELAKYRFEPTGTFNGFNPTCYTNRRIDHIFVSKGSSVSRYGILTYHYLRDLKSAEQEMGTAAPKVIKCEVREIKCISDHYFVQSFVTLNGKRSK